MARKRSSKAAQMQASIVTAAEEYISGKYKLVNVCAKDHGVSATTLTARLDGRGTHVESNEANQLLTGAEERMLVKRCTELTENGLPPRKATIVEMAAEIIRRRDP